MDFTSRLSKSLHAVLSSIIGTQKQLSTRRDIMDIHETLESSLTEKSNYRLRTSGSYREGVRSNDSDIDIMYWPTDHKVVFDLNQSTLYDKDTTFILMEYSTNQPGSTLLKLLTTTKNKRVSNARVNIIDKISSSKYREENLHFFKSDSIPHGPCASGKDHNFEYDHVHCFECDVWPSIANPWIDRCRQKQWPNPLVLTNILNYGCHVVPIRVKDSPEEDLEWRISFNIAEHMLIYSLDHSQFMCYGLLKIFLKDVINKEVSESVLSSYYMKTVLFWVIQENLVQSWTPDTTLRCFWTCFEYLLKCVDKGELPNFFIPENNMYRGKILNSLNVHLNKLYNMGLKCLLLSPSLEPYLSLLLSDSENDISVIDTETELDVGLFREIEESDSFYHLCNYNYNLQDCSTLLSTARNLNKSGLNEGESLALRKFTCTILQRASFQLIASYDNHCNKMSYYNDKLVLCDLRKAALFGCVSDMLYIVHYFYITDRHQEALSVVKTTKEKLQQPNIVYDGIANIDEYMGAVGGQPLKVKFHTSVAMNYKVVKTGRFSFKEFNQEQLFSSQPYLLVAPFVMVYVFEILCLTDKKEQEQALIDLNSIVHIDSNDKVPVRQKEVCLKFLEMCKKFV